MIIVKIDEVELPTPTTYAVASADFDSPNTKLTEAYKLKRERVRAGRLKVMLTYEDLTIQELKVISDAIRPASVNVTFFDPWSFEVLTKQMYASAEKTATAKIIKGSDVSKWQTSFNLTEY